MNPSCPNCGSSQNPYFSVRDENRRCTDEVFSWFRCSKCGIISLGSPPNDLSLYYGSDYYKMPTVQRLEVLATRENAKMEAILPYATGKRLLEIGPAFGAFARRAYREGFDVTVIERDKRCCEYIRAMGDIQVVHEEDPVAAMKKLPPFDVIVLWHVIEHLRDPFLFLTAASGCLRPGGLLVFATPNPEAWQFKVMGVHWPHLDAPRHLHILSASAITKYCEAQGLKPLRLISNDEDSRSWNRFGWQRLLMNRMRGRIFQLVGFALGTVLAALMSPFELAPMRGSAYTMTFRKHMRLSNEKL